MTLKIGIVAGEPSGDRLGGDLFRALKRSTPIASVGIGGTELVAEGLESLVPLDALSMHGFREPLQRLPFLWDTLKRVEQQMLDAQVDVFVGVDFNVFNLLLERRLRRRGIAVVHYVSPSVYAWRRGRTRRVARAADVLLTLFPFEPAMYAGQPIRAVYVGHPLADQIQRRDAAKLLDTGSYESQAPRSARQEARVSLGLLPDETVITLMPGSRMSEINSMLVPFLRTAQLLKQHMPAVKFLLPCATSAIETRIRNELDQPGFAELLATPVYNKSRELLAASDAALIKSGTSTLEAMLLGIPMVVAYRLPALTYRIVRPLLRTKFVALPNILAGEELVPELLQDQMQPEALARAVLEQLDEVNQRPLKERFLQIHSELQQGASANAAEEILRLVGRTNVE